MTEERDPKVSAAYRGLGAEEPPRALDEAILAAARREAGARPSPLLQRAGRQRWYAPLATAAVLVLAVAVTLNMQIERPGIESPAQQASVPLPTADRDVAKAREKDAAKTAEKEVARSLQKEDANTVAAPEVKHVQRQAAVPAAAEEMKDATRKTEEQALARTAPAAAAPAAPAPSVTREPSPFMAQKPAAAGSARSDDARDMASSVSGSLAPQAAPAEKRSGPADRAELGAAASHAEATARMQVQKLAETPERELERIAELRAQGRHDEADKALAEFRKRNPDYKIPDAMRARVERR